MPNSKKNKFVVIFLTMVFLSLIIIPQNAEAKIHQNQKYGFQIEYPDNWAIKDTIVNLEAMPGINSGSSLLVTLTDGINWWNHFISVTLTREDFFAINYNDQSYLKEIENTLTDACNFSELEIEGYICSKHSIIDSKIIEIDGHQAYQIKELWTETYPDNSTTDMISILTDIIVNDDVWSIRSINKANYFLNSSEVIENVIKSFKFIEKVEGKQSDDVQSIIDKTLSPLKQFKSGTLAYDIQCKQDMVLMIKNNGNPACVSSTSAEKLESRGWGTSA